MRRTAIVCLLVLVAACKGRGKNDQQYQTAKVDRGNIKAPKIIVAEGAKFRGSVDMGKPKDAAGK